MNTILYFNQYTKEEANVMAVDATIKFGVAPVKMQIGRDVTKEEVEDTLVIDLDRTSIPFVTSADDDTIIDLYDTDEEVEYEEYTDWDDYMVGS